MLAGAWAGRTTLVPMSKAPEDTTKDDKNETEGGESKKEKESPRQGPVKADDSTPPAWWEKARAALVGELLEADPPEIETDDTAAPAWWEKARAGLLEEMKSKQPNSDGSANENEPEKPRKSWGARLMWGNE